jgi:superfamily I DNA/RNA helicase
LEVAAGPPPSAVEPADLRADEATPSLALADADRVSLMTLHTAKGLEFPAAFLVGLEEYLLPHANSMGEAAELEEERRLCYVGVTRAQDLLFLSFAETRNVAGSPEARSPSRFLGEMGEANVAELEPLDVDDVVTYEPWGRRGRPTLY